jgi:hypothetical protein
MVRMMRLSLVLVGLCLLLTACKRHGVLIQHELAGTWAVELGGNLRIKEVIQPNGGYESQISGYTNGQIATINGILMVSGNNLTDMVTKHEQTNLPSPAILHGSLVHIDGQEWIAKWEGLPGVMVARRIAP